MSRSSMFWRKQTRSWYVKIDGKFIPLGRDEREARKRYQSLLAPESRADRDDAHCLATAYLGYLAVNRSKGTYRIASAHLRSFLESLPTAMSAASVKGFHLRQWADRRFTTSDTYKNQGMRTVKACWAWAASEGLIPSDALKPVKLPPAGQRETFFGIDQWQTIVDGAGNEPFRDYLTIALESGLRPQEIHQARVRHWQPQYGTLVFERAVSKGKKTRVIPLNPASIQIVERLVANKGPEDHIFLNTEGRPWCKDSINCAMRRLRRKLQLPGLCAYALRHSFCYARLVQGADPLAVAKAMGHVNTTMIETRYGHVEKNIDYLKRGKVLADNPFTLT